MWAFLAWSALDSLLSTGNTGFLSFTTTWGQWTGFTVPGPESQVGFRNCTPRVISHSVEQGAQLPQSSWPHMNATRADNGPQENQGNTVNSDAANLRGTRYATGKGERGGLWVYTILTRAEGWDPHNLQTPHLRSSVNTLIGDPTPRSCTWVTHPQSPGWLPLPDPETGLHVHSLQGEPLPRPCSWDHTSTGMHRDGP